MSSNLSITKVCQHEPCKKIFTAKKYTTKFCSLTCAQRDYKLKAKQDRIQRVEKETKTTMQEMHSTPSNDSAAINQQSRELIDIASLAFITSLSERTLFRMMKDPDFPRIKIESNLRFHKETVIKYIMEKNTVYERKNEKESNSKRKKSKPVH